MDVVKKLRIAVELVNREIMILIEGYVFLRYPVFTVSELLMYAVAKVSRLLEICTLRAQQETG